MARSLASKPNVEAPSGSYPFGRIKDNNGSNNGTPVNEQVYGDFHQFFAKLLSDAGITPNGQPENSTNGFQYVQALVQRIQALALPVSGGAMAGGINMNGNTITGLPAASFNDQAVNKGQLDAAINNLINGAPGALDALNELAAAMGNDPNFAATVANALAGKVAKTGDTMSGPLNVPGINTDNVTVKIKKLDMGAWNMGTTTFLSVPHGLDFEKILSVGILIRNDVNSVKIVSDSLLDSITPTEITLITSPNYSSYTGTGFSRGKIIVFYEP